jgi:hypothetical protein
MQDGKKLLFNSFWSSSGWSDNDISDEVFQICKAQGYMFDPPEVITHEDYMNRLAKVVRSIDPYDVAGAFLYSLSTRLLEYRSALGSYWYAVAVPGHQWPDDKTYHCPVCGWRRWSDRDQSRHRGFNVLNFERYKWGGVRHTNGQYALFDLEQFMLLPKVTPTDEDIKLFEDILGCVAEMDPDKKVGELQKIITSKKMIKSNKSELQTLLDILGICGILSSPDNPCYADSFVDTYGRDPVEYKNDFAYPTNRWRASDGINTDRLHIVFQGYDVLPM